MMRDALMLLDASKLGDLDECIVVNKTTFLLSASCCRQEPFGLDL